jgi:CheY-like chemotaxis protein
MTPHILIVDDDATTRAALALLLAAEGYATAEAANGREALLRVHAGGQQQLVVLDLAMPLMDGWEFLRARRLVPELSQTPVIVLSAVGEPHLAAARALGASEVLQKPVEAQDVLDAVRRYCLPVP